MDGYKLDLSTISAVQLTTLIDTGVNEQFRTARKMVNIFSSRLKENKENSVVRRETNKSLIYRSNKSDARSINVHYSVLAAGLLLAATVITTSLADDNAAGFDLSSLATIASNIGSNPQIMNVVSSLLQPKPPSSTSPGAAIAAPASPATGVLTQTGADSAGAIELDQPLPALPPPPPPPPVPSADEGSAANEPLKRANRAPSQTVASPAPVPANSPNPAGVAGPTDAGKPGAPGANHAASGTALDANSLNGLMSLLPGVLPNLNLSGLAGLLNTSKIPPASNPSSPQAPPPPSSSQSNAVVAARAGTADQAASGGPTAQSVINQVLTAYVSGQIPNELIQMALSGKVPSQIIELALSGQVPSPLLQMIITGQVPTSTIAAFLNSMQNSSSSSGSNNNNNNDNNSNNYGGSASASPQNPTGSHASTRGPFATTRSILEALFSNSGRRSSQAKAEKPSIKVPTILGPVPVQLPTGALSNVRRFGQLVGGTITNMASMIPY